MSSGSLLPQPLERAALALHDDDIAELEPGDRDLAPPLVVYCHLRWSSVFQRPQQLLSRIARRRRIVFVEEPVRGTRSGWEMEQPVRNLLVARPVTPVDAPGFHPAQLPQLEPLLQRLLKWRGIGPHSAWLYTPMAWPLASAARPDAVVYDCMDELSGFAGAPEGLAERERELLAAADVVFTGGPSLFRAKSGLHPRVRCMPSSVDVEHFRAAPRELPADLAAIPRPRLGFFGVLDERLDRELLDALAISHPEWQIVLIGPVVKIPPDSLPRRANLHYLGERPYAELPGYLHGWDACLLPFALNDATRFISPTKTLEYMAAELPIISTPIRDVEEPYGGIVHVAPAAGFAAACERALSEPPDQRLLRTARMRDVLARRSWDATVEAMLRELEQVEPVRRSPIRGVSRLAVVGDAR
jgi:UDP-galactopyranose mutase